jgi:hypothetical protein
MSIVLRLCCLAAVVGFPLSLWAEVPPGKSEKLTVKPEKKGVDGASDSATDHDEIMKRLMLTTAEVRMLRESKAEDQLKIESLFRRIHKLEMKVEAQRRELKRLRSERSDRKLGENEASQGHAAPIPCLVVPTNKPCEDDIIHINTRIFQIPIRILPPPPNEVCQLLLYVSRDQGRKWEIYARATPDKKVFDFATSKDGLLYFTIGRSDETGLSDPPDIYQAPVGQKILVDTVKPSVRIVSVKRVGDKVMVIWEIQEENPDWTSLRLEYRMGDSPTSPWTPLGIIPGKRGNMLFSPGGPGSLTLRLTLSDIAGNKGGDWRLVPAPENHDRPTSSR